ncbi:ATP synthase F1 subunit epsilon [Natronoflexus pectinivorans]|uniref:F-type H+-transporting ATPase subunit epsilon n=1 Tax=Natronoflexus pectinivorans TaxID=682526 RepID=A0A4R2GRX2_9BACT|nr:ATP synthase F1 subunit epsilon [Natronoflexus pectinivorans]TCO10926.1 F-type H+-transporting ATPase subunit epsilon [Natronoflexus pectinivorans]
MTDLYLEVVTPEKILFEGPVGMVEVPGELGRFTVLRDHGPIISTLTQGRIRIIGKDGVERHFLCRKGVVECKENRMTVLMDHTTGVEEGK